MSIFGVSMIVMIMFGIVIRVKVVLIRLIVIVVFYSELRKRLLRYM